MDGSRPRPTPLRPARAHKTGWARPLDGPEPRLAPRPLTPSLTVSAAPAPGGEGAGGGRRDPDASVCHTFPEGSARALTSESRRSEAEQRGYPGASSSGS